MASSELPLSLYVHVPFCVDKCLYCNFYSLPARTVAEGIQESVVNETIEQARFFREALGNDGPPQTVFMGGGTPSTLVRPLLSRMLSALGNPSCPEWTVEANPESIDEEFLEICCGAGVTRISAGVQSTNDRHLRALRRTGSRRDIARAVGLLRRRWNADLNLDFIAGIPGQEPREVASDLALLDELPASHVSLYSLTYEPGTPLERLVETGKVRPNSADRDEELWFAGVTELRRRGYAHYEISNFCRPGKECRHNLRYWRLEPYLGVGPSAVSTLPAAPIARTLGRPELAEPGAVLRMTNPSDVHAFLLGRDSLWGARLETVRPADFLVETLMMGLRLEEGIPTAAFLRRFGSSFDEIFPGLWGSWVSQGVAHPAGDRLAMSDSGRMMLDGLLAAMPPEAKDRELRVRWP
ncbi:MAG: coproporphyrinogen-III oxidase family protein [Spirochaetia bacterium]